MNPGLIAGYDAIKKLGQIYFALLQKLLTTIHTIGTLNWCQQFRSPPCTNLHAHVIVHDRMDNASARRRRVICRSRITIRSTDSMFSSTVMVDGRPIRGASSKPCPGLLNSATHLATVQYDGAESL